MAHFGRYSYVALTLALTLSAASWVGGCGEPTAPVAYAQQTTARLRQSLTLTPSEVQVGDSLTATLTIRNRTDLPINVTSSYGCVAFLIVHYQNDTVPFRGTDFACTTSFRTFALPPLDSLISTYQLRALVVGADSLPPPGTYTLETAMLIAELSNLEVKFTIIR